MVSSAMQLMRLFVERAVFEPRWRKETFSFLHPSRPILRPNKPSVQSVLRVFSGGKVAGEFDHSPPSSAEVKMSGAIPLLPLCALSSAQGQACLYGT
jgi:hypothetical protein